MNSEVNSILERFISRENSYANIKRFFIENKIEATSLLGAVIAVIVAFLGAIFSKSTVSFIAVLVFFAFLVVYSLSSFLSSFKFFVGATKETLLGIKARHQNDYLLAEEISFLKEESMEQVKCLLDAQIKYLECRVGFLVGVLDKLGIVPAIIMIYLAYVKTTGTTSMFEFSPFSLGLIAWVYLAAIVARITIDALKDKIIVLDLAINLSKKRKAFKLP
ncbi:hypothetical protein ACYAPA_003970 [Vibrio mimicus]